MNEDLKRLGDRYWAFTLRSEPTSASLLGFHEYDAEIEDLSRQAEDDHIDTLERLAVAAQALDVKTY